MLEVMDYCIENNVKGITLIKEWCQLVGIEPSNINNIRNGNRSFTTQQISACCNHFNISADFIYGFTNYMVRSNKQLNSMQLLKMAVRLVDKDFQDKKAVKNTKQQPQTKRHR